MTINPVFDTVLIIGGGLIGSSLARAAQTFQACKKTIIYDADKTVRSELTQLKVGDEVPDDLSDCVSQADLIILAVPPGRMGDAAKSISSYVQPGTIVTDAGSVKESIIDAVEAALSDEVIFIGGHPIAGTEHSGPAAGFATLFKDRWCILTPTDEKSAEAKKLKQFWEALGSEVAFMDAKRHDLVLATTSHLPHLIAYALVGTATDMETVTRNEVVKYSAGGFRDFTRIAASNPEMWRDVFLGNREGVLEVLGRYIEDLTALKRAIRWSDGDSLLNEFTKTRDIRKRIIDAGQDSAEPNFGRDHLSED
ncbi:MAG: prephenate/arogenate dehydrogenase family protein [Hyphomonadaceae bacterium]|nr:prephenate/arogenate dehydrogenase family protein [Hyphomonadaceae bacterium]